MKVTIKISFFICFLLSCNLEIENRKNMVESKISNEDIRGCDLPLGLDTSFINYEKFRIDNYDCNGISDLIMDKTKKSKEQYLDSLRKYFHPSLKDSSLRVINNSKYKISFYPIARIKVNQENDVFLLEKFEHSFPLFLREVYGLVFNYKKCLFTDLMIFHLDESVCSHDKDDIGCFVGNDMIYLEYNSDTGLDSITSNGIFRAYLCEKKKLSINSEGKFFADSIIERRKEYLLLNSKYVPKTKSQ